MKTWIVTKHFPSAGGDRIDYVLSGQGETLRAAFVDLCETLKIEESKQEQKIHEVVNAIEHVEREIER